MSFLGGLLPIFAARLPKCSKSAFWSHFCPYLAPDPPNGPNERSGAYFAHIRGQAPKTEKLEPSEATWLETTRENSTQTDRLEHTEATCLRKPETTRERQANSSPPRTLGTENTRENKTSVSRRLLKETIRINWLGFTGLRFNSPCSLALPPQSRSKKLFKKTGSASVPSVSLHLVAFRFEHVYARVDTSIYIYIYIYIYVEREREIRACASMLAYAGIWICEHVPAYAFICLLMPPHAIIEVPH